MKERSKSVMLLIEITIMLLVFALCASVCLRLFAGARNMANDAKELSNAAMWAQSAAEVYKSSGGELAETADILGGTVSDGRMELRFDEDWHEGGGAYLLTIDGNGAVRVTDGEETIYSLNVEAVSYGR